MSSSCLYVPSIKSDGNTVDYLVVYFKTLSLRLSSDGMVYNLKGFKGLGRCHI
jgi:hypothetical protein